MEEKAPTTMEEIEGITEIWKERIEKMKMEEEGVVGRK